MATSGFCKDKFVCHRALGLAAVDMRAVFIYSESTF